MAFLDTKLQRNVLNGFYRGQVLKHCSAGKCKIWIPGVYTEEAVAHPEMLPDAEQASPLFGGSSNGSGIFTYPRINAVVWCFFLNGDQNMPVYFAASNGGPEGMRQYTEIGPVGKYEKYGKVHDHIIDNTDKISDAEIHRINVSKGLISFYEDGSIATTVLKTNPVTSPYNVNLPYSESNHVLNDLSNVIFPGKVTDAMFVSDSPYNYHTNDVVSGLNNTAFGISCNIKMSPSDVYNEITSKIGACCMKGYKTQCRYVYGKQGSALKKKDAIIPIYIEDDNEAPVNYHWQMFNTIYDVELKADDIPVYQVTFKKKVAKAKIDGILYKVGDKLRISKREIVRDISKALVYKVEDKTPQCMVLIAAEDTKIDKWEYILSSGYDLFLCSPTQFDNPVLYFDKPLDKKYPALCPTVKWPRLVDPKVATYKASIILMEDRRKFAQQTFNKNGTIGRVLSDSYDESYVSDMMSATGDYEYHAYKQDYEDWNKTHNYYQGQAVQANVSGYNAMNMGFANDDDKHNGYISVWNYQVRLHIPKSPAEWWYYNDFLEWDQHNGLCIFNNNLSINNIPEYWQNTIDETTEWPRWNRMIPMDPFLREHISCTYNMNVNDGIAEYSFAHLSNYDMMSHTKMSVDYHGNISVENTKSFDMFITDMKHAAIINPLRNFPYIRNEWTHIRFNREGEISAHSTKFMELSVSDPYQPYKKSLFLMAADGKISVYNTDEINLFTTTPLPIRPPADEKEQALRENAWPPFKPGTELNPPLMDSILPYNCVNSDPYETAKFSHMKMNKKGVIEIESSDSLDIFCAKHQKCKQDIPTAAKSVDPNKTEKDEPVGNSPCLPPRAHYKLDGCNGTIHGDCCNTIDFFSSNGSIILENNNAKGPTDIIVKNTNASKGITIENSDKGDIKIHTANGKIDILADAGGSITIKTGSGTITLSQSGNLSINAPSNVNITAPEVTMSGNLKVTGNIVANGTVTDKGCTLATHVHSRPHNDTGACLANTGTGTG